MHQRRVARRTAGSATSRCTRHHPPDSEPGSGDFLARVDNLAEIDPEGAEVYAGGVPAVVRSTALTVEADPGTALQDVFRLLVPTNRHLTLADESALRADIPADLPKLLHLNEWNHPDDLWGVRPSDHETFRLITEVLDSRDPDRYRPTLPANTHWHHRPEPGTL